MTPIEEGRARLAALLPEARERAAQTKPADTVSPLAKATLAGLTEAHLDAMVIQPGERGGWHCDLVFKDRPPGVPNAMGSPVGTPFHTREGAEAFALPLLASVLSMIGTPEPEQPPVFWLHETVLELSPSVLASGAKMELSQRISVEAARAGLHLRLQWLGLLESCTVEDIDRLSAEQRRSLMAAVHAAAICGVFTWPLREAREPGELTAVQEIKL